MRDFDSGLQVVQDNLIRIPFALMGIYLIAMFVDDNQLTLAAISHASPDGPKVLAAFGAVCVLGPILALSLLIALSVIRVCRGILLMIGASLRVSSSAVRELVSWYCLSRP